ncbi:MAG: hypothetical protein RML12_09650 [Xanthomonadales bacterium]|nr:hypothetical protein [Xanthomonadales bacterium]
MRRVLGGLPGVRAAEVNLLTGRLSLAWEPDRIALSAILRATRRDRLPAHASRRPGCRGPRAQRRGAPP